ncbi:unnamed protein product [Phytophthora fragariaefolia]|uniref:Unnamed protein product n=1 Tax=Phytophthora fragariaefolia TaxID=1490495 RepID=A0A9W7CU12_9STRA|nr:unnamed protein product [Phytophthora fragariaefolia]
MLPPRTRNRRYQYQFLKLSSNRPGQTPQKVSTSTTARKSCAGLTGQVHPPGTIISGAIIFNMPRTSTSSCLLCAPHQIALNGVPMSRRSPQQRVARGVMELSEWRAAVPYGAYMQPIHLRVAASSPPSLVPSAAQKSRAKSVKNAPQSSSSRPEDPPNGTSTAATPPEPPADPETAQNAAQATGDTESVSVIPAFGCESLDGGQKMALNVGGPVWAMDWLPSKPAADAAAVAAALVKPKQKKARRGSAAAKAAAKSAAKGKENNKVESSEEVDGETTAASNGSAEPEEAAKQEWRFLALATHPPCQVEDGKLVKATPPDHYYDVPESARSLIQIWAVPVNRRRDNDSRQKSGEATKRRLLKPRVVYAIDHESGVAWDLQWCPLIKKFPKTERREQLMGILAACFGDGSMRVFEIPEVPENMLLQGICKNGVVEKNVPVVVARLPRILQLSVQWSPHKWNMLLTGGSDGTLLFPFLFLERGMLIFCCQHHRLRVALEH